MTNRFGVFLVASVYIDMSKLIINIRNFQNVPILFLNYEILS